MKRSVRNILCLALAVASVAAMTSCSGLKKMKYDENGLLCCGNLAYRYAPLGYEPTSQGTGYALIDGVIKEELYTIGDEDPEKWLTTEYVDSATMVYYSTDIQLPSLAELDPEICYMCDQGDSGVFCLYAIGENGSEDEKELIDRLTDMLCDDSVETEIWPRADIEETYQLKFYSSEWSAIYYNVVYAVGSGKNYLYDKVRDRCILAGDLLSEFHENDEADTEA